MTEGVYKKIISKALVATTITSQVRIWRRMFLFVFLFILFSFSLASAHTILLGDLEGIIDGNTIAVKVIFPEERIVEDTDLFQKYTQDTLQFVNDAQSCQLAVKEFKGGDPSSVFLTVTCPSAIKVLEVSSTYFLEEGYQFTAVFSKGENRQSFIFNDSDQKTSFDFSSGSSQVLLNLSKKVLQFIWLGMRHIYSGYDHILFILALILVSRKFRELVKIVSAFTLAHTTTLALAAYQLVNVSPRLTEPLIALSIAYVALSNFGVEQFPSLAKRFPAAKAHRWQAVFGFGLFHGLGFASNLQALKVLPQDLITSLLSFNIGVEIGQLTIIALVLPCLFLILKLPRSKMLLNFCLLGVGLFGFGLFLQRLFF